MKSFKCLNKWIVQIIKQVKLFKCLNEWVVQIIKQVKSFKCLHKCLVWTGLFKIGPPISVIVLKKGADVNAQGGYSAMLSRVLPKKGILISSFSYSSSHLRVP